MQTIALFFALSVAPLLAEEAHIEVHDHGAHLHREHRAKSGTLPADVREFIASGAAAEAFQREDGSCALEDSRPKAIPTVKVEPYEIPESFLVRMQYKRSASQEDIDAKFETRAKDALSSSGLAEIAKKMASALKDSPLSALKVDPLESGGILKFFGGETKVGFDFKESNKKVASMTMAPLWFVDDTKCMIKFRCPPEHHCKCLVTSIAMAVTAETFNAAVQNVLVEQWLEALSIFAWQGWQKDFQLSEWVRVEPKDAAKLKKGAMPMPWGPVFWIPPAAAGKLGTLRNCAPSAVLDALGIQASQTVPRTLAEHEEVEGEAAAPGDGEAVDSKEIHFSPSPHSQSRSVRADGEDEDAGIQEGAMRNGKARLVRTAE